VDGGDGAKEAGALGIGVGIDGCAGGWVVATVRPRGAPAAIASVRVISRIDALEGCLAEEGVEPRRCLIDIPIGLVTAGLRPVDLAAKTLLGRKAATVFAVPPRPVFDALDFDEANRLARDCMGQGLSVQAWNIMGKIREVDLHLRRRHPARPRLRESHPELVFARLAATTATAVDLAAHGKKTAAGRTARLAVLTTLGIDATALVAAGLTHAGGRVAADDLLDALALAVAARLPEQALARVPAEGGVDPLGLPMEIVVPA
jgi:predicted RNase H-like nuclease